MNRLFLILLIILFSTKTFADIGYSGSFSGDDTGIWMICVDDTGGVEGVVFSDNENRQDVFDGIIDQDGNGSAYSSIITMWFSVDPTVSGTWQSVVGSEAGVISGDINGDLVAGFKGSYSGELTHFEETGTWSFEISDYGCISGIIIISGAEYIIYGAVNSETILLGDDISVNASIDSSGLIVGHWCFNGFPDNGGVLNGIKDVPMSDVEDSKDENSSSGGGCFIKTL